MGSLCRMSDRGRVVAGVALALLPACGGCAGAGSARGTRGSEAQAFAERLEGIENLARIHPGLYRGAQPDEEELRWLRERGVKTVVNLRSRHSERERVEALGMACVEIPMDAGLLDADPPTSEDVRRFFEVALDPARQPVFFHCAEGKDRTGTMAALYRIEVEGWSPERAVEEMRAFGFHGIYRDLERFVRSYEPRGFAGPEKR